MSSLSVRKLPKELERALIREAKREGKTKTEVVLEALESRVGLGHRAKRREQLRRFFGKMTEREFQAFRKATKGFSEIERELWE